MIDRPLVILLAVLAIVPVLDPFLPETLRFVSLMPPVLIFALIGLGLTVATGFTGLLHLGVAAFVALGAYTFAICTCSIYPFQLPWIIAVFLAGLVGGICGFILGIPTLRLRGDYLAIVTLGFGEITQDVLRNVESITKGTQGINPLPGPDLGTVQVSSLTPFWWYYLILTLVALVAIALKRLLVSPVGRSWLAVKSDELAASCMGVHVVRVKLATFSLSAAVCAVGGALMASFLGSSGEPSNYDFQVSIMALSMIIVGGLGSIAGAILGSIVMVGLNSIVLAKLADASAALVGPNPNVLLNPGNWKYMIFGLALVLMMRFKSEGFLPYLPPRRSS